MEKEEKEKNILMVNQYLKENNLNGKRNGKGKEYYNNGELEFEGEYLNGKKWEGKGYDNSNKIVYELKKGKGLVKEYIILVN